MATFSTELEQLAPMPEFSEANWPSYLYLSLLALNSVAICTLASDVGAIGLILLQAWFMVGLFELMHQAAHRRFVTSGVWNETLGNLAAALIGLNFTAFRYFHLEHHRHTCDEGDPEGLIYSNVARSRWNWLIAPVLHGAAVWRINQLASRFVPASRRADWMGSNAMLALVLVGLVLWLVLAPRSFLLCYLLPFLLFTWLDYLFSQAEHYGAKVRGIDDSVNVANLTLDLRMPRWISLLMLHRNLHRVHHVWPRTRWFEAPSFLPALDRAQPGRVISLTGFIARWLTQGPRQWQ